MKWPFDLKYLSKILFQLTRPPEDWTFPSSWMHTTIWSNHSQCISLYIYKTLRSFWDLNNLDFCTVSTLTCHDENSFLKKKKFRDETPWGTNPIPPSPRKLWQNRALYSFVSKLYQSQIRPNSQIYWYLSFIHLNLATLTQISHFGHSVTSPWLQLLK